MRNLATELQQQLQRERYPRLIWLSVRSCVGLMVLATVLGGAEILVRLARWAPPYVPPARQERVWRSAAEQLDSAFGSRVFIPDRYLLWSFRAGREFLGHVIEPETTLSSSFGHPRGAATEKHLLVLGDSVASAAYRTFADVLERLVAAGEPSRALRVTNASVPAYSTEQLRRRFARLRSQHYDIVLVCAGWADHAPHFGGPDRWFGFRSRSSEMIWRWLGVSHLLRLLASEPWRGWGQTEGLSVRVPPGEFEANLRRLVREIHATGATAILMTQPEALDSVTTRQLGYIHFLGPAALRRLHRDYNARVRRVAVGTGAVLIDLEQEFARRNRQRLLEGDGMHLSPPGHNLAARLILAALADQGLFTSEEFTRMVRRARYDTTAPDQPQASWRVAPERIETESTCSRVMLSVLVRNVGNTIWLQHHTPPSPSTFPAQAYGSTRFVARWWDLAESRTAAAPRRVQSFELVGDVFPREATSQTLVLEPPAQRGSYAVQLGLETAGIGSLARFGAVETSIPVTLR